MDEALRRAVLQRLSALDEVAEQADASTLLPLARAEIQRLADGWRLLLTVHQPGEDGRCKACPARMRRRKWPCQIWLMAHQHLIGEGVPHRERRGPLRNPFSRRSAAPQHEPPFPAPMSAPPETPAETTIELPVVPAAPLSTPADPASGQIHRAAVTGLPPLPPAVC